jgi:hypothetical protein
LTSYSADGAGFASRRVMPEKNNAPPTAEENERVDRQPGAKGHPRQPGAAKNSPERQREAEPPLAERESPNPNPKP